MTEDEILHAVMTTSEVEHLAGLARGTVLKAAQQGRVKARSIIEERDPQTGKHHKRWLILRSDAERLWPKLKVQHREEWPDFDDFEDDLQEQIRLEHEDYDPNDDGT